MSGIAGFIDTLQQISARMVRISHIVNNSVLRYIVYYISEPFAGNAEDIAHKAVVLFAPPVLAIPLKNIHLGWCIIDTKNIEKTIASLNEIGLSKITFIKCKYTQSKYKINFDKLNKLLQNSSSQCGRSDIIQLDTCNSLEEFIKNNPDTYMFNFSKNNINDKKDDIKTILLGCEGGFSTDEVNMLSEDKIVGCNINAILKSETASISIASILLN